MAMRSYAARVPRWMGALGMVLALPAARADAVTEWNSTACQVLADARIDPGASHRALAIMHSALYQAAAAAARDQPGRPAALRAAIAASARASLLALAPAQQDAIEQAYRAALAQPGAADQDGMDGMDGKEGVALAAATSAGQQAAAGVLAARADDGAGAAPDYRQAGAGPGAYLPTTPGVPPVASSWGRRRPWLMAGAAAFRPGPPPALDSAVWARDYNEVRDYGARSGSRRSDAQTAAAQFWQATRPAIYYGAVRAVAEAPGRGLLPNARLYAALAQAIDDTLIGVFEAKYHYHFWRPLTAIRHGDSDGNDATTADPAWTPLLDTPNHPEYPCAHCAVASVVATVLQAELGAAAGPLATTSPDHPALRRSWATLAEFSQEVSLARIHGGVHFRSSTEAGSAMGQRIGALAAAAFRLGSD
jgi:hypothetical protein